MNSLFLNRISFREALRIQEQTLLAVQSAQQRGTLLGFESDPVITLGRRGNLQEDVVGFSRDSYAVEHLDRGGQATLHNPGQLVIFPILSIRIWGAKYWVEGLAEVTRQCLAEWKIESGWDPECPGLYTAGGKIMSCGVRIRDGVSTHGIAINVNNDLSAFSQIRSCGISGAKIDKMNLPVPLAEVFSVWVDKFQKYFFASALPTSLDS